MSKKGYILLYLIFCIVGGGLEWVFGALWSSAGTALWTYPDSLLHHTSWAALPQWGFGGLVGIFIYRALLEKRASFLLRAIPPLILSALWVLIYSWFIA